jgi:ABC-type nitrate/sulfonate/bicarbonate transport system substrate-binding protein
MKTKSKFAKFTAAIIAASAMASGAAQAQNQVMEAIIFAGASAMPIYVAQEKGFFAREGLDVKTTPTPDSGFQMGNLIDGKFQVASTAVDNLIAYQEGQGSAKTQRTPDLIVIMGGGSTALALMALPSIKNMNDLKGKEFALDSLTTGYAFVLRRMLESNGFGPNDFIFVRTGGTRERFEALKAGTKAAGLISEPFTTQAKEAGFTFIGDAIQSVGRYQATVQIANRDWAKANEKATVGYIRAMISAIDWIYDPANTQEAAKILAAKVKIPEAAALPSIEGLTKGQAALAPKGALDVEGLKTVISLREQYAAPQKKMSAPEKYYDLTYYNKAVGK